VLTISTLQPATDSFRSVSGAPECAQDEMGAESRNAVLYRRDFLCTAPFVAVAAVGPSRDWLLATLDATQRRPGGKIGHAQVVAIREAFDAYQEADVMLGGGHARRALAQYVTGHVLPLVREVDPDTNTGASTRWRVAARNARASSSSSTMEWGFPPVIPRWSRWW
jgi:hypothetical protein